MVTSPFHLMLYDNQSNIVMFDNTSGINYKSLLSLATKPLAGFVTLADIKNSGSERGIQINLTFVQIMIEINCSWFLC